MLSVSVTSSVLQSCYVRNCCFLGVILVVKLLCLFFQVDPQPRGERFDKDISFGLSPPKSITFCSFYLFITIHYHLLQEAASLMRTELSLRIVFLLCSSGRGSSFSSRSMTYLILGSGSLTPVTGSI